jgi:hypothetical protein
MRFLGEAQCLRGYLGFIDLDIGLTVDGKDSYLEMGKVFAWEKSHSKLGSFG